jgi:chromosome partitioning protein
LLTNEQTGESAGSLANRPNHLNVARTIAVCTQKGGVGKTTSVSNLAAAWGAMGHRVLAIDFDPQFALSRRFGIAPSAVPTLYDVLAGPRELPDVVLEEVAPGVDLVPAERRLAGVELSLVTELKREQFLARAIADHTGSYDFLLIDCPPNLGLLTVNALCAAREALVPIDMEDVDALQGAEELVATVRALVTTGDEIEIAALVRVRADRRRLAYGAINEALFELELPVAETEIPDRAEFHQSAIAQEPLVVSRPDSAGALAYRRLAEELAVHSPLIEGVVSGG